MPSEAMKQDTVSFPQGKWVAYRQEANGYRPLGENVLRDKTVMELVNGPYVLRFDLPTQGRVYFAGYDEALWNRLQGEGKTVRGLWELFEGLRQDFITKGLPTKTSIYRWTVGSMWSHGAALEVFPGAKVEVRE